MHEHFVKMTATDQKDKKEHLFFFFFKASLASGANWNKAGQSLSV